MCQAPGGTWCGSLVLNKIKTTTMIKPHQKRAGYLDHSVSFPGQTAFNDESRPNKCVLFTKGYCHVHCAVFYNVL